MSLTVLVTTADGTLHRFGRDEPDARWVPFGITFESTVPGGWKSGSFSLRRRIDEPIELSLYDDVEIIDETGRPVYEGRIQQLPRQHGDDFLLGVVCLGHAVHLTDDTTFSQNYVNRDMSQWQEASLDRRIALGASGAGQGKIGMSITSPDGIAWTPPNEAMPSGEMAEAWYDSGVGHTAFYVSYRGKRQGSFASFEAPLLWGGADLASTTGSAAMTLDDATHIIDLTAGPPETLMVRCATGAGVTPPVGIVQVLSEIGVYGDHWLTGHPTDDGHFGYYIDDILSHALTVAAPKLNFTTGPGGSIERPALLVPHADYSELGTVDAAILDLNKYVLWDWGVGPGKQVFFRPPDPDRLTWEARMDRGIHLSLEGDDAEHVYNGCIVKFRRPDGTERIAGPTGGGFDVESDLLVDTDPRNPVNAHHIPRRYAELDVSFPLLDTYAPILGAAYLYQASLPARSGTIDLVWEVEHPQKGMRPVSEMFAGEFIRLSDHPADVPRRMISVRYTDDGRQCSVTVGNDMNTVEAMLEQLGVTTRIRLGGS